MDLSMVVEIISTLGFPVALTIACVWMFYKCYTWMRDDAKERELRDRETIKEFSHIIATNSEALLKNGEALQKVAEKLNDVDDKISDLQRDVSEIKIKQQNK